MWRELFVLALSAVAVAVAEPQGSCGIVKADQDQSTLASPSLHFILCETVLEYY